jgi:hypothetical protein
MFVHLSNLWGANKITKTTPVYFLTAFVIAFWKIFLQYFGNVFEKIFKKIF